MEVSIYRVMTHWCITRRRRDRAWEIMIEYIGPLNEWILSLYITSLSPFGKRKPFFMLVRALFYPMHSAIIHRTVPFADTCPGTYGSCSSIGPCANGSPTNMWRAYGLILNRRVQTENTCRICPAIMVGYRMKTMEQ